MPAQYLKLKMQGIIWSLCQKATKPIALTVLIPKKITEQIRPSSYIMLFV